MFALPTFALADEPTTDEPARELNLDVAAFAAKFAEYVVAENPGLYVEMGEEFQLNQEWLKDEAKVQALFPGINYRVLPDEQDVEDVEENKFTLTYKPGDHAKLNDETAQADITKQILKTKHETLNSATTFEVESTDFEFAGWKVVYTPTGEATKTEYYRAGDVFVMPACTVEATAMWKAKDGENGFEFTYEINDIICIEYCTPSDDPRDEHWTRERADKTIKLETAGWWMLRYVVVDGEKGDITDKDAIITSYNTDSFKNAIKDGPYTRESFYLKRYAVDTSNPESALSDAMKTTMNDGLTVNKPYTVVTSLKITDSSTTTVTYTVWRYSGANGFNNSEGATNSGEWVQIYDSAAKSGERVLEGGEAYISAGGVITPVAGDVTENTSLYRYKVVYTVKDANGYFGVGKELDVNGETDSETGEFHPVLMMGVKLSKEDAASKEKMEVWKIILFVIAGLSAVGIVLLLVIKPKQATESGARVSAVKDADANKDSDAADAPTDDKSDNE